MRSLEVWLRRGVLPAVAVCALVAGCAGHYDTRSLGVPVTMAPAAGQAVPGDTFSVTTHAVFLLWGLAPAKQPSLPQILAGPLGAGSAVNNLSIHTRMRWSDVLLTVMTLGIVSTNSVTFSGVVARGAP